MPRLRHSCRCPSPARTSSNTNSPTFPPDLGDDRWILFVNCRCPLTLSAQNKRGALAISPAILVLPGKPGVTHNGLILATTVGLKMGGSRVRSELYQQTIYSSLEFHKNFAGRMQWGHARWAWVRFGLCQAVKKTGSTSDNLVWLTRTRRFHPALCGTQLLPKGQPLRFR